MTYVMELMHGDRGSGTKLSWTWAHMACDVMTWPNVPCAKLPPWLYDLVYHVTWNSCMGIGWQVLT